MPDAKTIYVELRRPLLRAGAMLGALSAAMIAAGSYNAHMSQARAAAEQNFQGLVTEYQTALESEHILRTEAERFARLHAQGFVGPEPRLRWIEDVRKTAADADLVAIRYELGPRAAAPANIASVATGSFQLFASPMRLELELRHEGDLLTFLNLLEARRGGLFDLSACSLRQAREAADISLREGNVKVDCELRWYSLDSPDTAPDAGTGETAQ